MDVEPINNVEEHGNGEVNIVNGGEPVAYRTRAALEEIPRTITASIHPPPNGQANGVTWAATVNLPVSYLSPTPSPDELVIRGRGRRSLPLEWSPIPIMESPQKRQDKTPVKRQGKGIIMIRSSPRKRLQLTDPSPTQQLENRKVLLQMSPVMKKYKSMSVSPNVSSPEVAIKGLSQKQLVDVLSQVIDRHPELKDEISNILPAPDLKHFEDVLNLHKRLIFKSLPTSRLASKTDSPAFSKASPHIVTFKKTIIEQGLQLEEAEQWQSLLDYVFLAWSYVRTTPVWDSPNHNLSGRKACFKVLTQFCLKGLRNVQWTHDQLEALTKKLEQCRVEYEDVEECLSYLHKYSRTLLNNTL